MMLLCSHLKFQAHLKPADGEKLIARGQVVRLGRTLIVTKAEVFAFKDGKETLCALMQQTIMVHARQVGEASTMAGYLTPYSKTF